MYSCFVVKEQHEAKIAVLRIAIDEGDVSGIAEGNVFERVREKPNCLDAALAPWASSVSRFVPKPICSTSTFIRFADGAKSRPVAISASLKIVARFSPIIPPSVASVMKFALACGA